MKKNILFTLATVLLLSTAAFAQKKKGAAPEMIYMTISVFSIPQEGMSNELARRKAIESNDQFTLGLLEQSRQGLIGSAQMTGSTDPADISLANGFKSYDTLEGYLNAASVLGWSIDAFSAVPVGGVVQYHLILKKEKPEVKK